MTLMAVPTLPRPTNGTRRKVKHEHSDLQGFIKEFVDSGMEIALVSGLHAEGYISTKSCYRSLWAAAKQSGRPVKVCLRGCSVYLVRR